MHVAVDLFGHERAEPRVVDRKEAAALVEVLLALRAHPAVAWAERMNTGAAKIGDRFVRFGWRGCPECWGSSDGRVLGVEVKSAAGRLRPEQRVSLTKSAVPVAWASWPATAGDVRRRNGGQLKAKKHVRTRPGLSVREAEDRRTAAQLATLAEEIAAVSGPGRPAADSTTRRPRERTVTMFALTTITMTACATCMATPCPTCRPASLTLLAAGVVADAAPGDEPPPPQVRMIRRRPGSRIMRP